MKRTIEVDESCKRFKTGNEGSAPSIQEAGQMPRFKSEGPSGASFKMLQLSWRFGKEEKNYK